MAGLIILAHLLSPTDYGRLAMVAAIVGVAGTLGDVGLSLATVQHDDVTAKQLNAAFWLNAAMGALLTGAVCALAAPIARFYGDVALGPVVVALSPVFLLNGVVGQFRAEAMRRGRFFQLAASDVVAQATALVVATAAALVGMRYWSLVLQQVVLSIIALAYIAASSSWWPNRPSWPRGLSRLVRTGAPNGAVQLGNYISANVDNVAVGRFLGASAVGIYSRGFQLVMLPAQQILAPLTRVALPTLVAVRGTERYPDYVRRAQLLFGYGPLLGVVLFGALAEPMIALLLGRNWLGAAVVVPILCIGGIFQVLSYVPYWILLTEKRLHQFLPWDVCGRSLMVAAIVVAAPHGIRWVSWSVSLGLFITWVLIIGPAFRHVPFTRSEIMRPLLRPAVLASTLLILVRLADEAVLGYVSYVARVGTGLFVTLIVLGVAVLATPCGSDVKDALGFLRRSA